MSDHVTHVKLLDAAAEVFLRDGFDAASMEQVRLAAGVSNGSLYHHFPNKARLASALYAHTLRDFHAALLKSVSANSSAQDGVQAMVRAYIRWVQAHPGRARLLHELRRSGDAFAIEDGWTEANATAFARLSQWIAVQAKAGHMQVLTLPVWMALVFGPVMTLTPLWVKSPRPLVSTSLRFTLARAAWRAVAPIDEAP